MAILASVLSLSSQIHLHAFLSQIVVTAGTSTEATSNDVGPAAGSIKLPSLQALQHAFTYLLDLPWALTRRKYQRIIQGQLSLVDLLQLMATCSIIQGIRIWGRRSAAQKAQSETRDDERPGSNAWSLTSDTGSKSGGCLLILRLGPKKPSLTDGRPRSLRPWFIKEAFDS